MKEPQIVIMKKTGRLKLSLGQYFTHYAIVSLLIIPVLFFIFDFLYFLFTGEYSGNRTPYNLLKVNTPFILFGLIFFFIQYRRLNFRFLRLNIPKHSIEETIRKTAAELEWRIVTNESNLKIYKTYPKWTTGSWGEQITIILDKDLIMINSICDPDKVASLISFGRNKRNMNLLVHKIKKPAANKG
jgi:hypothetical protein